MTLAPTTKPLGTFLIAIFLAVATCVLEGVGTALAFTGSKVEAIPAALSSSPRSADALSRVARSGVGGGALAIPALLRVRSTAVVKRGLGASLAPSPAARSGCP